MKFSFNLALSAVLALSFSHGLYGRITADIPVSTKRQEADSTRTYVLDEMTVTGTRVEKSKSRVPVSITVIGRKELEERNLHNALSAVNSSVPGLFISERNLQGFGVGPASSGKMSIRGVGGSPTTNLLVLVDGQPQFMGLFGHPVYDSYMTEDIERVEVIRGPGSVLYGSNAMGGAINMVTRKIGKEGLAISAGLSVGSYKTADADASVSYKNDRFSLRIASASSYSGGHRSQGDDMFRNSMGSFKMTYAFAPAFRVLLDGNISDSRFHDPGPEWQTRRNNYYDYLRGRIAVTAENTFGSSDGALSIYYSFGKHDFFDGWNSNDNLLGMSLYQNIAFSSKGSLTIGTEYKRFGGDAASAVPFYGMNRDLSVDEKDVYALIQYSPLQRAELNAGCRVTRNSVYGTESVPQFGLSYLLAQNSTIKLSAGKSFRSPTVADIYLYPVSNEALKPERAWNYEAGITNSFFRKRLSTELTLFYIEGDNMIRVAPSLRKKQNTGSFMNRGIEAAGSAIISEALSLSSNYSYIRTNGKQPFTPEHQLNIEPRYSSGNVSLSLAVKAVSGLYIGSQQSALKDRTSYATLAVNLNYKFSQAFRGYVRCDNLLNKKYYIEEGYPMPGIIVMAGLRMTY